MSTDLNNLPRIPDYVMACIHAYGDARADDDGTSSEHLRHAIEELRGWAGRAAAPAGGAEPVAVPEGWKRVLVNEGFDGLMDSLERAHRKGYMPDAITEDYEGFDYRDAAPTAQPQPQPESVVLFDDRPQNQRIAEAEERMRNPAPLQFEDEAAQPERLPYVSALDPAMQTIKAQTKPWEPSAIAQLQHLVDDIVVTVREEDGVDVHKVADGMGLAFSNMIGAVKRLLAAQPEAPAEPAETVTQIECRECSNCGHIGINDGHDTDAACSACDWSGTSPDEDKCPGCGSEGTMVTACPKCSNQYRVIAEMRLATPAPVAQPPAPHPKSELATRCETALDSLEAMLGGRNGPSIQLRAWVRELSTVDGGPPTAPAQQPAELTDEQITAAWKAWPELSITSASKAISFLRFVEKFKAQGGSQ